MRIFADCIPIAASTDEIGNTVVTVVVPFRKYIDFYSECVLFSQTYGIDASDLAGETTLTIYEWQIRHSYMCCLQQIV